MWRRRRVGLSLCAKSKQLVDAFYELEDEACHGGGSTEKVCIPARPARLRRLADRVIELLVAFTEAVNSVYATVTARTLLAAIARMVTLVLTISLADIEQRREHPPRSPSPPGRLVTTQPDLALAPPAPPAAPHDGWRAGGRAA